jgi:D-tyrosyl-tRNA(Tyr) deacylase
MAEPLYQAFLERMHGALGGKQVASGKFGAMMQIALVDDGPVTIIIDTRRRE